MFVCDLHCDLLSYLVMKGERSPFNEEARCSLPQLSRGGVGLQVLAIFTETKPGSTQEGDAQLKAFRALPSSFAHMKEIKWPEHTRDRVHVLPAFESASGFAEEDEPLEAALKRLERHIKESGPFLYISLTWNTENRFGGGNHSKVGLKEDGKALLEFLDKKNIAIDFSHTSDPLAYDIFNYIDKKRLHLTPVASHSNFRRVKDHPRNLSDDIAKEIAKRGGIMGINLFRPFVGEHFRESLIQIVEHATTLGVERNLCFGADFFYESDFDTVLSYMRPFFDHDFPDASCYPKILSLFATRFPKEVVEGVACKNFEAFLKRC